MASDSETINQVIAAFRTARDVNLRKTEREGHLIRLTAETADEVLVTADLHGHRLNFLRILEHADLAENPRRHLVMQEVCHGGPSYPGTNADMSHLMLEDVARLLGEFPDQVHFLLSNHELAELTDFPITKSKRMLNLSFRCGMQEMYGERCEDVRDAMLRFLRSCPIGIQMSNGVFVSHSTPENLLKRPFDTSVFTRQWSEDDLAPGGDVFRLVWGRDFRSENGSEFARLVKSNVLIHGHEPCVAGYDVPNKYQVIIDCTDDRACYVMLPLDRKLDQATVVDLIRPLHESQR